MDSTPSEFSTDAFAHSGGKVPLQERHSMRSRTAQHFAQMCRSSATGQFMINLSLWWGRCTAAPPLGKLCSTRVCAVWWYQLQGAAGEEARLAMQACSIQGHGLSWAKDASFCKGQHTCIAQAAVAGDSREGVAVQCDGVQRAEGVWSAPLVRQRGCQHVFCSSGRDTTREQHDGKDSAADDMMVQG